ncbi:MAG: DUF2218 domain-containing protein [Rhodospirillales bacterium]|nr:DUF2218 domain-containing protein [Rhodospirillales bacterium]MBO6785716.1 DUF2218 domain-containing protein [Rhodospirillales bacterium]
MTAFSTNIKTDHAQKYLQQLCKHFAHKVTVEYSPHEGRVAFPPGRCLMNADETTLTFYCLAREDRAIPVIQSILDKHLVKFAWREELEYEWINTLPDDLLAKLARDDFLPDVDGETGR